VREFALEQLTQVGEVAATRAVHVAALLHFLDSDRSPEDWGRGFGKFSWSFAHLVWERENLRQALSWCAEQHETVSGLQLATGSAYFWAHAGPRAEGLSWLRRFLEPEMPDVPAWLRQESLWLTAYLATELEDMALARASLAAGLAVAEPKQDAQLLMYLSFATQLAFKEGDLAAAETFAQRLLVLTRRMGHAVGQGSALNDLGVVAYLRGDWAGAAGWCREVLALQPRTPQQFWAQKNLGYLALQDGRIAEALAAFRAALVEAGRQRREFAALELLAAFAAVARVRSNWERAARLLGAVDAGLDRLGGMLQAIGRLERERTLAATREHLGEPAYAAAYAGGRALTLDEAVAEALAGDV
jgi:tetratricopeptide (TPR) repeat protein